jgi:hypothetical protein
MASTLDLTDVPVVAPEDLAVPMRLLIESEQALMLLRGLGRPELGAIEQAFWQHFNGNTALGLAVLLRFWNLIDVFSARRLKDLLLHRGYGLIAPAVDVGSSMRLNAKWGFNPQKFLCALKTLEAELAEIERAETAAARDQLRIAA